MAKIFIDRGHGGIDTGASSILGFSESVMNIVLSLPLSDRLSVFHDVKFSPEPMPGTKLSLQDRCALANNWPADLFLSIHCNSADNHEAHGIEVFTSPGQTRADALATRIIQEFEALEMTVRKDFEDGDADKEEPFYVLRHTKMPAVLIEFGFLSNAGDSRDLQSPSMRSLMARAVSRAVESSIRIVD